MPRIDSVPLPTEPDQDTTLQPPSPDKLRLPPHYPYLTTTGVTDKATISSVGPRNYEPKPPTASGPTGLGLTGVTPAVSTKSSVIDTNSTSTPVQQSTKSNRGTSRVSSHRDRGSGIPPSEKSVISTLVVPPPLPSVGGVGGVGVNKPYGALARKTPSKIAIAKDLGARQSNLSELTTMTTDDMLGGGGGGGVMFTGVDADGQPLSGTNNDAGGGGTSRRTTTGSTTGTAMNSEKSFLE